MEAANGKSILLEIGGLLKKMIYAVIIVSGIFVGMYNKDLAVILTCTVLIVVSFFVDREKTDSIVPAFLISLVWILISRKLYYGYNSFEMSIFGISVFPLFAWPAGLYAFYLFTYDLFSYDVWWKRWIKVSFIYSIGIIVFESIGYNVFNIHLNAGEGYPGWPLLNIFHCPWWMQAAYFANGIIFLFIINSRLHYSWSVRRTFASVYMFFR